MTYAVCYLHIKQIAISQERRAIWKNYRWTSFIISRVLSNKTNLIFISCTLFKTQPGPAAKNATPRPPAGNRTRDPGSLDQRYTDSLQRSTDSVAQRVRFSAWRPWSCIFRNWSRLGLKMYIFPTLEFTLL